MAGACIPTLSNSEATYQRLASTERRVIDPSGPPGPQSSRQVQAVSTVELPENEGTHLELSDMHTHKSNPSLRKQSSSIGDRATQNKLRRVNTAAFAALGKWLDNEGGTEDKNTDAVQPDIGRSLSRQRTQEAPIVTFKDAMENFMSFLSIDPDGGISNLLDAHQKYGSGQVSKFPSLEKDMSKRVVALVYICRLALNIPAVIFGSANICYCFWSPDCPSFTQMGHDDDLKKVKLPLEEIALIVAAWEVVAGVALILKVCYHGVMFMFTKSPDAQLDSEEAAKMDFEKYRHLVSFFWDGMQKLQNFSALRALGAVHPGLLSHYSKDCNVGNTAALQLLEHYLDLPDHEHLTEEEVLEQGVAQLVRLRYGPGKKDGKEDLRTSDAVQHKLHEYILLDSYSLLCEIKNAERENASHPDRQQYSSRRKESLRGLWRVCFVGWVELIAFWTKAFFLACFGWAAFMIKLVEVAVVLFDPLSSLKHISIKTLAFMNQIMGIIGVNQLLRWRLFRFIFGGQDAYVSAEERLVMHFYEARLVQAIWTSHAIPSYERWLILLTFDDDDLQGLIIEESDVEKATKNGLLWRALAKRAHICGCCKAAHDQAYQGFFHVWSSKFVKAFF